MQIYEEIPRGQLSTFILSTLLEGDKYGYEIIDSISTKTEGSVVVKQPSLYSCLRRMEQQNLISSYWRDSEIGGRRHYYSITDYGKKYVEKWQAEFIKKAEPTTKDSAQEKHVEDNKSSTIKDEVASSPTILHQTNLFSTNETQKDKAKNPATSPVPTPEKQSSAFLQYDLFNSSFITRPSVDLFETLQATENANLTPLPINTESNGIQTNINIKPEIIQPPVQNKLYQLNVEQETNGKVVNEPINIKQEFLLHKSKHISFADKIKTSEPIINEKENLILSQTIKEDYSLPDNAKHEKQDKNLNISKQLFEILDSDANNDLPTIFQSTNFDSENNMPKTEEQPKTELLQENEEASAADKTNADSELKPATKEQTKDGGIYILDKVDPLLMPKSHRLYSERFKKFNNSENLQYQSKISSVLDSKYNHNEESANINEPANTSDSEIQPLQNHADFYDLKEFYKQNDINLYIHEQKHSKIDKKPANFIKVNKLNVWVSTTTFALVLLQSLICYLFFNASQPSFNFLYFVIPVLVLPYIVLSYVNFSRNKSKIAPKSAVINYGFLNRLIVTFAVILTITSINLLLGFTFKNFSDYLTTELFICLISFIYPLDNFVKFVFIKTKFAYK